MRTASVVGGLLAALAASPALGSGQSPGWYVTAGFGQAPVAVTVEFGAGARLPRVPVRLEALFRMIEGGTACLFECVPGGNVLQFSATALPVSVGPVDGFAGVAVGNYWHESWNWSRPGVGYELGLGVRAGDSVAIQMGYSYFSEAGGRDVYMDGIFARIQVLVAQFTGR